MKNKFEEIYCSIPFIKSKWLCKHNIHKWQLRRCYKSISNNVDEKGFGTATYKYEPYYVCCICKKKRGK